MATTSTRIAYLANGVRDTTGAVVASAKARFYNPGTLVAGVVYSDAACTTPYTQPVTCNAGGQGTVYTLEAVRMIVKDTTETTSYFDDIVNLVRADSVYVTHASINGGVETTLESALSEVATTYSESATATARDFTDVIRNLGIQAEDYGVTADGTTDDTTFLQAAIDRAEALGATRVLLPIGTIKLTGPVTIDAAGVSIEGQGRGMSILKNFSTTGNCVNVTLASGDAKLFLKGFSITANTTSSGTGLNISVGDKVVVEDVGIGLHRTGLDCSAVTGTDIRHCFIDSTDDNAAAIGMNLGAAGRAERPEVTSGTDNGTGIKSSGVDCRIYDAYVTNFATAIHANAARTLIRDPNVSGPTTGISLAAANGQVSGGVVASTTTGISITAANCVVNGGVQSACTTGVSVGAVAGTMLAFNVGSGNTTDLSVNASATLLTERHNSYATASNAAGSWIEPISGRGNINQTAYTGTASQNFAPVVGQHVINQFYWNNNTAGSGITVTIDNVASTANVQTGDWLFLLVTNRHNAQTVLISWGSEYKSAGGTQGPFNTVNVSTNGAGSKWFAFRWSGTVWNCMFEGAGNG